MKTTTLYIAASLALLSVTGCTENEMEGFSESPSVYFMNGSMRDESGAYITQDDSVNQSFFIYGDDVTRDTVYIIVNAMGGPANVDRPIALEQTNAGKPDAAVVGVHYIGFDNAEVKDSVCIPAGKVYARVPVILLRDKSLQTQQKRLELRVKQNEYFRPGIDEFRQFIVTTTDLAVKPTYWDTRWKYYFGPTFGSVKLKFIINATGYTDFDNIPSDYSYLTWLKTTVQQAFFDYNKAHPNDPLKEADGTLVTFE